MKKNNKKWTRNLDKQLRELMTTGLPRREVAERLTAVAGRPITVWAAASRSTFLKKRDAARVAYLEQKQKERKEPKPVVPVLPPAPEPKPVVLVLPPPSPLPPAPKPPVVSSMVMVQFGHGPYAIGTLEATPREFLEVFERGCAILLPPANHRIPLTLSEIMALLAYLAKRK